MKEYDLVVREAGAAGKSDLIKRWAYLKDHIGLKEEFNLEQ